MHLNKKAALMAALISTLYGCVTAKPVPLPDGTQGYVIDECDSPAKCYRKAAETCGGKYEVVSETASSALLIPVYTLTFRCAQ